MELSERLCKAVGGFIPVFQRDVDDFRMIRRKLDAGKGQPAVSDVLPRNYFDKLWRISRKGNSREWDGSLTISAANYSHSVNPQRMLKIR